MMNLVTIAISMHVRCASCQSSIHLGAIVDRARCPRCGKIEQLPPERWRGFLDSACNDGPNLPHSEAQLRYDDDEAWIIATKVAPKCAACNQPFPENAAQNGRTHGKCFCVGCGAKIGVRPVPDAFAAMLPRITHLLGEDTTQLKNPDAPNVDPTAIVSVKCPDCGGNIQPDGKSHGVRCPYCSVLVILSQTVWKRFATKNEPHVFYLVHDPAIPRPLGRADVKWGSLDDVITDAQGNLYGIGEHEDSSFSNTRIVFALDSRLKTKWVHKSIAIEDDGELAWRSDGVLFAWSPRRFSAILLRATDGEEIGKLGAQQPKDAQTFNLDLSDTKGLGIDLSDGTILFSKRKRLVRCAPDGSAQFTWPPGQGLFGGMFVDKLLPFGDSSDADYTSFDEIGDRPTKLYGVEICMGWDGRTYLRDSNRIACFDRLGKRLWYVEVDSEKFKSVNDWGVDARGVVNLLNEMESYTSSIHRIWNGQVIPFIDGRNPQTPIRDERRLAVHPDGTLVVASYGRNLRIFSPDGRPLYFSEKALEEDKRHEKRKAEKAAGDRVY